MDNTEVTVISSSEALETITRSEIDIQISTAKKYPRSIGQFKEMALSMACLDQETAESCFYSLPRGGKAIVGPSVRLAEIVVSAWGNVRAGSRIISNDGRTITAQAMCHDLQTNVAITIEVKRKITNKDGVKYNEDMQVVAGNAACAIALRNAVFKVVPMAFTKEIFEQSKKVAIGSALDIQTRRTNAVDYFKKLGVAQDRILTAVGKGSVEDIGVEELTILLGLKTAIKDGDTTIADAFPNTAAEAKSAAVAQSISSVVKNIVKPPVSKEEAVKPVVIPDKPRATEAPEAVVTFTPTTMTVEEEIDMVDPYSEVALNKMSLEELKEMCVEENIDYHKYEGANTKKKLKTLIWEKHQGMPSSINKVAVVTARPHVEEAAPVVYSNPSAESELSGFIIPEVNELGKRSFPHMKALYEYMEANMLDNDKIMVAVKALGFDYVNKEDMVKRAPAAKIQQVFDNCPKTLFQ